MASTHPSRRPAVKPASAPQFVKSKSKPPHTNPLADPDHLAQHLSNLTISTKPKPNSKPSSSSGDGRSVTRVATAMRAVNAALQSLSGLVQSGWRAGSGKKSSEAVGAGEKALRELRELRVVCVGDLDVERAALSVVGKLVVLEMYDAALAVLTEMRTPLSALFGPPISKLATQTDVLTLPLPPSSTSLSEALQTLISTYLLHALVILSHKFQFESHSQSQWQALSNTLQSTPSLLRWLPHLPSLQLKHKDSMLTRVYSVLAKLPSSPSPSPTNHTASSNPSSNSRTTFELRTYALQCLLHTSSGCIEPNTFWEQATKFCIAFVRASSSSLPSSSPTPLPPASSETREEEVVRVVLSAFGVLVSGVDVREDHGGWMRGRGFVGFCECWMGFAKRAGDVEVLDRISELMQGASPASSPASSTSQPRPQPEPHAHPRTQTSGEPTPSIPRTPKEKDALILEGARICAVFARATAIVERHHGSDSDSNPDRKDELTKEMNEATTFLSRCRAFFALSWDIKRGNEEADDDDGDLRRAKGKAERALERLRRAAVKLMDATPRRDREGVEAFLSGVVSVYEGFEKQDADIITPALDTLFVLARTALVTGEYETYNVAYEYLSRAATLLGLSSSSDHPTSSLGSPSSSPDLANYVRCISGAYHNLAGTLYQDGKYMGAIRFLKEGCAFGGRALILRGGNEIEQAGGEGKGDESWRLLREQLYRRWELLGICYSKIGERRLAYEAFIECVKSYPYANVGFAQLAGTSALSTVFTSSASAKQLGVIIDRLTYIGTCELFLQPPDVSLRPQLETCNLTSTIIGTLIERQIEGLEGSLWKEGVQKVMKTLLVDALGVYSASGGMPIRRARVLIRCLEFGYRAAGDGEVLRHPDDIGEEAEELLGRDALGQDASLAQFCPQYRALLHFWLALHAHRREDSQQTSLIAHHSEEACRILKSFIGPAAAPLNKPSPAKKSPKTVRGKAKASTTSTKKASTRRGPPTKSGRNLDPITPMARKALEPVTLNTSQVTPPRPAGEVKKSVLVFDDFDGLLGLLRMVSHLLGLVGLVLVKVKLLDVTRRLCERHAGTSHDGYITASVDLAHEYIKLGKTVKASTIYGQVLIAIRNGGPSDEVQTTFLLRYAESLAIVNNVLRSSSTYCEALGLSTNLPGEDKGMTTAQRVKARVGSLERAAIAAHTYGVIQYARDDLTGSLDGMLQSLRLWNRAVDTLARLNPPASKSAPDPDENPFEMSSLKDALPASESDPSQQPELSTPKKTFKRRPAMDGLEWRITDGLLNTLFALCHAYFARGSPREADYFAQQAQDLAESLNAPAMVSRALTRKGEIQLHQGQLDDGYASLMRAAELLEDIPGPDAVDIRRLRGDFSQLKAMHGDAHELYEGAARMLEELEKLFSGLDGLSSGLRKSTGLSPKSAPTKEVVVPALLAAVLRQHIWLLRDDAGDDCRRLLERFIDLPPTGETKSEENALMARLTLHDVYGRFRADMFLSSLVESTIALPMGMSGDKLFSLSPSTQEILTILDNAEKLFWADLAIVARRGKVSRMRDATVSLAMIRALQSSLGRATKMGPVLTAGLLDLSTAITLRRELLEAIQQKFPNLQAFDDLQWPLITPSGSPLPRPKTRIRARMAFLDSDDDDGFNLDETSLKQYWDNIRDKYNNRSFDLANLSASQADCLPNNWTVISINITEDKNTMFVTRQRAQQEPLIFCVPLKGRRETEEDEHLTFDDALNELKQIITLSNQGTRQAIHIKNDDPQARASWWAERSALDKRMQELLENIEFCWLGAFKTILSQPMKTQPDIIADLRIRFDKVFKRNLQSQERKQKTKIRLDDNLLECFSTLSPKCRDEEIEDLVYFILDLYQLHGVPVAISDVDIDQVVVDLRTALEEHAVKSRGKVTPVEDNHMFLVLDKNVQGIPWESIPILRGRSVSRIPSMDFLMDRLEFAKWQKSAGHREESEAVVDRAEVDPRKAYYVLNPSGDLMGTEGRFSSWLQEMNDVGWEGTIGRPPSEQQFLDALARKDLVVYFGHGGGEQYVRSHKIRHLPRCAATMLWGCSSGALREMGDFDRVGTPYNYMLAGCPTLVANIWDVTDRDIDKFSQAVFDKMRLNTAGLRQRTQQSRTSIEGVSLVAAVAQSRSVCKLKYLTGAAPVVYGIPFYL